VVKYAASDVRPGADLGWWGPLQHDALTLVQKVRLATDGTVTRILGAFAGEAMQLVKLSQEMVALGSADPGLDGAEGEEIVSRRILLRGAQSGCNFLYAESLILPHRLHPRLRHGLSYSDAPIGRLLSEHRIETARELIRWGLEPAESCASYFGIDPVRPWCRAHIGSSPSASPSCSSPRSSVRSRCPYQDDLGAIGPGPWGQAVVRMSTTPE
jgi:chorismate-pyruvate lyase